MTVRADEKIMRLASIPLFSGLRRRDLERIGQLCTRSDAPAGSVLCRQGASGHEFFIILEGSAEVTIDGDVVNTLGAGDFFGELALLDDGPRIATVTATSPVVVLVLTGSEFKALVSEEPQVAANLLPAIGERLRSIRAGA